MELSDDILIKVITGNATSEETDLVAAWRIQSSENASRFNQLQLIWKYSSVPDVAFSPNSDNAWKKVSEKITKTTSYLYLKIAASVAFIIGLSIIIRFFALKNNTSENKIVTHTLIDTVAVKKTQEHRIIATNKVKELFLEDSTLVTLNVNSEITYNDFSDTKTRSVYLNGQAQFDVVPNKNKFIVKTTELMIEVVGTHFIVNENKSENSVDIIVEEGLVKAYANTNQTNSVLISANKKYSYNTKTKTFEEIKNYKKQKWWQHFFSKLKKIVTRIKFNKHKKNNS